MITNRYLILPFLLLLFIFITMGCASSKKASRNEIVQSLTSTQELQQDSTYQEDIIGPGDRLEILVMGHDDLNTQTTVSSTGTIVMPIIGEIKVDGMTKSDLKTELKNRFEKYLKGEIELTISILNKRDNIITVLGSVNQPNNFQVVDNISVFALLSKAGGTTNEADLQNVKIYRRSHNPQYQKIDMTKYFRDGKLNPKVQVGPGDIVYIPPKKNVVRELSSFLRDVIIVFGLFRTVN